MSGSLRQALFAVGGTAFLGTAMAALLFLFAGRWDLPWFWVYLAVYATISFAGFLLIDPGLIRERLRPGPNAHDQMLIPIGKVLITAHLIIAGLDVGRFHGSAKITVAVQAGAMVLFALSGAATVWMMVINPYFSTVVRIQVDRGHRLITAGPYGVVRHPGYVVICVLLVSSGPALGSWWSLLPIAVFTLLVLRRTALEDRFLQANLDGYADYAKRVRYRLIPGLW